jgi:thioredoxin reductase
MRWYADWLRLQVDKLEVEVRYRTSPDVEELKSYDAVIIATGGRVARPEIPGIDSPIVSTFEDVLRCTMENCKFNPGDKQPPQKCGQTVLVWGDHFGAADAAEQLASCGSKVYLVTENSEFAQWMEPCHRDVMMKRFSNGEGIQSKTIEHPVTVIPNSTVAEIAEGGVVTLMDNQFQEQALQVDNVVLASVLSDGSLHQQLIEAGRTATMIGDAAQVRNLHAAVTDGANAGLTLDEGLMLNANQMTISSTATL